MLDFSDPTIYEAPVDSPPQRIMQSTIPPTQLEEPVKRRVPLWMIGFAVVGGLTGFFMAWHNLNKDATFPPEVRIDINERAALAQNAIQDDSAEEVEPELETEIIDLGGDRPLPLDATNAGNALLNVLSDLEFDLECGYFNIYLKQGYEAADQGVNPMVPLRDQANDLLWEFNQVSAIASLQERTDKALVLNRRASVLALVVSVVSGNRTNDTPAFCTYATGESVNAS